MARTSFTLLMLGVAGAMALLLGTVGIYGVIAYSVSQRTREIGIRMALGAQRREIFTLILGQGVMMVGFGLVCGIALAFGSARVLRSMLYQVSSTDVLAYLLVAVSLTGATILACYFPARRAMKLNPMEALRTE
jgi:ABC-type antimicrobial peptide transport system permease subunit